MNNKKNKFLVYKKIFKFKKFFLNSNNELFSNKKMLNFIKIFKILTNLKHFGIFFPSNFEFNNNWIFAFWKKGFVSNFRLIRWFFINKIFVKTLPNFLINLTLNNDISLEIKKKEIPLINLKKFKIDSKFYDYYLNNNYNKEILNFDYLFFLIKTFNFLKNYKNV